MEVKSERAPLRIYVDHGEAYGNLGDEAMLLNALRRLDLHLGPCRFVLPAEPGRPLPKGLPPVETVPSPRLAFQRVARVLGLPAKLAGWKADGPGLWRKAAMLVGARKFNAAIRGCDAFFGVGAADFSDYWLEGVVYKCWLYRTARKFVKVSAVSAQGIGPLERPWARKLAGESFSHLDLLSFRDASESRRIVESLGPRGVRNAVVGDEAFSLPASGENQAAQYLEAAGAPAGRPFVAVHFRSTDYTRSTLELIPRLAGLLDRVAGVVPYSFVFVPMSYDAHSGQDQQYGQQIKARMIDGSRLHIASVARDVRVVKGAVRQARYTLGLSYHMHVFSLSQAHPAVILYTGGYYRAKSDGLLGFYGPPSAALDLNRATDEEVLQTVRRIEETYEASCAEIARVNEDLAARNDWTIVEMAKLLERG